MRNLWRAGILALSFATLCLLGAPAYGYTEQIGGEEVIVVDEEWLGEPDEGASVELEPYTDDWQGEIFCPEEFEPELCDIGSWVVNVPVDEFGVPEAYGEIG